MMFNPLSNYSLDLYTKDGTRTASLAGLADDLTIDQARNEADAIEFSVPLKLFQKYAKEHKRDPATLIQNRSTEVRVKRGQVEIAGGEIFHFNTVSTEGEPVIKVRATGFLNLFLQRYTDNPRTFTAENGADIAWTLINESQSQGTDWDFGITMGSIPTTGDHDITYKYTNIKDALQALTRRVNGPFDFEITPDKVFNCYTALGSLRKDIEFEYPGNILDFDIPSEGEELANYVMVFGSGISTDAAPAVIRQDTISQLNYKVRQKKITPNDVSETDTLQDKGDTELATFSTPFEIPTITVDGSKRPFVTDYRVGDYVRLKFSGNPFIDRNNLYRIERRKITKDKNDKEKVYLYLSI